MTAAQHKGVKPLKVALKNLGCRVNRAELDAIAASLEQAGCELVGEDEASIVVVNTCAVTGEAEAKARKSLRHYASLPQVQSVVATGCMATLFADEVASLGEKMQVEVLKTQVASCVLAEAGRLGLADAVAGAGKGLQDRPGGSLQVHESAPSASASQIAVDSSLLPVTSEAQGTVTPTGRMRPGIKIQDGCDNRCTYCIVWKARGPARSLSPHEAVAAVSQAVEQGAGEVVLTGIDLGRYDGGIGLAGLLDQLLVKTKVGRIRLSSVEPVELSDDLLRLMGDSSGRVAPFLHLPLQSGCDATLARMGRPYDTARYRAIVERARELVPGLALACDLIVGFPGETAQEFNQSLEFCRSMDYANMHVFRYSKRPGTPAAVAPDQVDPQVAHERSRLMRQMARQSRTSYLASCIGGQELAFIERPGRAITGGLAEVLVDSGAGFAPGSFVKVAPHSLLPSGQLDGRSATA